jgi:hypothetical protein
MAGEGDETSVLFLHQDCWRCESVTTATDSNSTWTRGGRFGGWEEVAAVQCKPQPSVDVVQAEKCTIRLVVDALRSWQPASFFPRQGAC